MSDSPIRCGIVGTGAFAEIHAQALAATASLTIAGSVDTDDKRRAAFASRYGGQAFGDVEGMLTAVSTDLITLCTPDEMHAEIAATILRHPRAPRLLVIEKPLCTSREQMRLLENLPQELRARIAVDHTRRFNPGIRRLRDRIASGELGMLRSGHWRYYAGWMHVGVHMVDLLRMLFGEITCTDACVQGPDRFPADPLLAVTLRSERFPGAMIRAEGVHEHPYRVFEGEFFLSKGRVRMSWNDVFIDGLGEEYAGAPQLAHAEHFTVHSPLESLGVLYASCTAFLRDGDASLMDCAGFAQAQRTMDVMFHAVEAARR